jgi:hypothetical protein
MKPKKNRFIAIAAASVAFAIYSSIAHADTTINVDFGSVTGYDYTGLGAAPDAGTTWNHFNSGAQEGVVNLSNAALVTSTGAASGVTLTCNSSTYNWGGGGDLLTDYLFVAGYGTRTISLSGIEANSAISLYLYGSVNNSYSTFALSGANGGATGSTGLAADYALLNGTADGSGNVSFTFTTAGPSPYGNLNGFQLLVASTGNPDTTPPVISTLDPADDATGVAVTSNIVATFSEAIARGTGNITVKNLTDGTQTTIAVTDTAQVSISGAVLTVNPTADLAGNKNYAVQIAATAVNDLANNAFAGISNDTVWNFVTEGASMVWNVDFGSVTGYDYTGLGAAPDAGTTWNHFNSGTQEGVVNLTNAALVTSTGAASGVTLTCNSSTYNWAGGGNLLADYLFVAGYGTSTISLSGIEANSAISLYLYGNVNGSYSTFALSGDNGGATGSTGPAADYALLNGTADGSGNVTFTFTTANAGLSHYGNLNGFQLLVASTGSASSYSTWAAANGITGQPASGDFDKDGLTNLVEYALGLSPTVSSVPPGTFNGSLLSFNKGAEAKANGDVTYEIEQSTTLGGWTVVVPNAPASATISYTLPSGQPKEFARLKITQIP